MSLKEMVLAMEYRVNQLESALSDLISVASECDGWESFPSEPLEEACNILNNKD